ncbi:MAG: hypothetical protein J6K97_02785 [Clostridia bacterium]|nr:hypothetical protein [Clostridia bacterium]
MKKYKSIKNISDDIILQMINLDNQAYKNNDAGIFEICKDWLSVNKDIYTVIECDEKVVGYINFFPVSEECYNRYKTGKMRDCEISAKDILPFSSSPVRCIFTSIVVDKNHQQGLVLKLLLKELKLKLKQLNVDIISILMDCVTKSGERLALEFGNAKFITTSPSGKLYETFNFDKLTNF